MYKTLKLENFRSFENFEMNLSPVTLIGGRNNIGKSSILDALYLEAMFTNTTAFANLLKCRGEISILPDPKSLWEPLYYKKNTENNISIELIDSNEHFEKLILEKNHSKISGEIYELNCKYSDSNLGTEFNGSYKFENFDIQPNNFFESVRRTELVIYGEDGVSIPGTRNIEYLNPRINTNNENISTGIGLLDLEGRKQELIEILKNIDENIENIAFLPENGIQNIYVKKSDGIVYPLSSMGDGIKKLLDIVNSLLTSNGIMLLVDEIETGMHYSVLENLWKIIFDLARKNKCQVIATTHSVECIAAASKALKDSTEDNLFSYVRIDRDRKDPNKKVARSYKRSNVRVALEDELELR